MDNEKALFAIRREAEMYRGLSGVFLRESIDPNLIDYLNSWLTQRRLIDPAIFINKSLCLLEGAPFGGRELEISVYAGSVAAVSDDLIDRCGFKALDRVALFTQSNEEFDLEGIYLLDFFNRKLKEMLPLDFTKKFRKIIFEYNRAQKDSRRLFDDFISPQELIDIKDRAGGYSVLLLHAMLFPDIELHQEEYPPVFDQRSITQSLYLFGAWLSKIDDLWDETKDRSVGMKQLATEGIVTWESLKVETNRVLGYLKSYYPETRVREMFQRYYAPLADKDMAVKYNVQ